MQKEQIQLLIIIAVDRDLTVGRNLEQEFVICIRGTGTKLDTGNL